MSAETLRRAAALMRERATACEQESPLDWQVYGTRVEDSSDMTVARCMTVADAEHIAGMHPVVALAVANWLDGQAVAYEFNARAWSAGAADPANRWAERGLTVAKNLAHHHRDALTVARAYLGEPA